MSEERKLREDIEQALKKALKPFIGKPIDDDLADKVKKALSAELALLSDDVPIPMFLVMPVGKDRFHIVFGEEE